MPSWVASSLSFRKSQRSYTGWGYESGAPPVTPKTCPLT
jgi:hypothetical protein